MKKILSLLVLVVFIVSCKKETIIEEPIVACRCNDGQTLPGSNASICGTYTLTTNGVSVILNHGGLKEYIRSTKTFCELFPGNIYCLGRNY